MDLFRTREVILACGRCGSAMGRASHRAYPGRLDVTDLQGAPLLNERCGRVLQRLDGALVGLPAPQAEALRGWLASNAVELVYRLDCPEHQTVWALAPEIAGAIRRSDPGARWVKVDTH